MNHIKKILIIACIIIFYSSCNKSDETEAMIKTETQITFISPDSMQHFNEEDTLWIRAFIQSTVALHEYLVQIRNVVTNEMVYTYEGHSHDKQQLINLYTFIEVSADTEMELIITTLDHNSNKTTSGRAFKVINSIKAERPKIVLLSPLGAEYNNGDDLHITGWVKHTQPIKELKLQIFQDGVEVNDYSPSHEGKDSVYFDFNYQINSPGNSDFELNIAAVDMNNNASVYTQRFHVHQ